MKNNEQFLNSGLNALNSLTADEKRAFSEATRESPELAQEAAELIETAAVLGLAERPVEPPAQLKTAILAQLKKTAQESRHERIEENFSPFTLNAANAVTSHEQSSQPNTASSTTAREKSARIRWFNPTAKILVAAAAAVALFICGGLVSTTLEQQNAPLTSNNASANSLAELSAAADLKTTHTSVAGGGEATVIWSNELGRAALIAHGLPSLSQDKTYEAWYISGERALPAGTFRPGENPTIWHVLNETLPRAGTIAVTVEPSGGSQMPTSTPILQVASS